MTQEPTREHLDLLLELQDTDTHLRRLQHQLDSLPEQQELDAAQARLDEHGRQRDDVTVELDRTGAEQRRLERETDVLTQRRDAERARLYDGTVTNAREMRSVEAEIETTQRRISEHEDLLLEILERTEALESAAAALDEAMASEQERIAAATVGRDEAAKSILAEQAELRARRDEQAAGLPASLLERYEAVVARTGGAGVGRLEGQACTACRIELSMADVGELYAGPPLATCPQCRRLLVIPD